MDCSIPSGCGLKHGGLGVRGWWYSVCGGGVPLLGFWRGLVLGLKPPRLFFWRTMLGVEGRRWLLGQLNLVDGCRPSTRFLWAWLLAAADESGVVPHPRGRLAVLAKMPLRSVDRALGELFECGLCVREDGPDGVSRYRVALGRPLFPEIREVRRGLSSALRARRVMDDGSGS